MCLLFCRGSEMCAASQPLLLRGRSRRRAVLAAAETHMLGIVVVCDDLVIFMSDVERSEIVDRAVIEERIIVPAAALISITAVAVAVFDTTIEADRRGPIAVMKDITAVDSTPVRRRPEHPCARRFDPRPWHPIIIPNIVAPGPKAGHPEIAFLGQGGLGIRRKRRRR